VHPVDVAWVIRTVVAVIAVTGVAGRVVEVEVDEPAAGMAKAETHDPTVTSAIVAGTVWVKVVVEV
jgi:hypothetical protein